MENQSKIANVKQILKHKYQDQLQCSIPDYEQQKDKVIYNLNLFNKQKTKSWVLKYRYSEFFEIHKYIQTIFENLPEFPQKTIFKLKSQKELEARRILLEKYMQAVVQRLEMINLYQIKQFLKLEENYPQIVQQYPEKQGEIQGFFHSVTDFKVDRKHNLLFVVGALKDKLAKLDSYLTNSKWFWENSQTQISKEENPEHPIGSVEFLIKQNNQYLHTYSRMFVKGYNFVVTALEWEPSKNQMLVGLESGELNILELIFVSNICKYETKQFQKIHKRKITGLFYDRVNQQVFSISADKYLQVFQNGLVVQKLKLEGELTTMKILRDHSKLVIGNNEGQIFIVTYGKNVCPVLEQTFKLQYAGQIRDLQIDTEQNIIYTINQDDGVLQGVKIKLKKLNKNNNTENDDDDNEPSLKVINQVLSFGNHFKKMPKCMDINIKRLEIYVGHEDGFISIWDLQSQQLIYTFMAHGKSVYKLEWYDLYKTLISASVDHSIKYWVLDNDWKNNQFDEESIERQYEQREFKKQINIQQENSLNEGLKLDMHKESITLDQDFINNDNKYTISEDQFNYINKQEKQKQNNIKQKIQQNEQQQNTSDEENEKNEETKKTDENEEQKDELIKQQ